MAQPTNPPSLRWGAATHLGQVRDGNEDAYLAEPMVFVVADGMGGHQAGEVASAMATATLSERLGNGASSIDIVVAAVVEANATIFQAAHTIAEQRGMGTTLTALVVLRTEATTSEDGDDTPSADYLALVNVGDSRAYVLRNGELRRATTDHSYVQELVATGHITEIEARSHPRRNIVTRALGIEPHVRVDTWVLPLMQGDRFLLCSDGLVDEVEDSEITKVLGANGDPNAAASALIDAANRNGGRDNVTVIVVDVHESTPSGAVDVTAEAPGSAPSTQMIVADPPTEQFPLTQSVATTTPKKRRLTPGVFLFGLGLAAILTITGVFIAAAVTKDDAPAPTTTVVASTTVQPTTTGAPTTSTAVSPTTVSPTTASPTTVSPTTVSLTTVSPTTASRTTVSPTTTRPTSPLSTASPTTAP